MNYVLHVLNKEKENVNLYSEEHYAYYDKLNQIDLAIKILSDEENLKFDNKYNFKKMKELLEKFISENMLSVYGQELAEDLLERINDNI